MTQNLFFSSLKFIFRDLLGDLLYFPVWWYTKGAVKIAFFCLKETRETSRRLSIKILFSHLLKPMYGQSDLAGRIISFFFRVLQFAWHLLFMLFWLVMVLIIFLFWVGLPVFTVWQIISFF